MTTLEGDSMRDIYVMTIAERRCTDREWPACLQEISRKSANKLRTARKSLVATAASIPSVKSCGSPATRKLVVQNIENKERELDHLAARRPNNTTRHHPGRAVPPRKEPLR
jgi:hypothetical protein